MAASVRTSALLRIMAPFYLKYIGVGVCSSPGARWLRFSLKIAQRDGYVGDLYSAFALRRVSGAADTMLDRKRSGLCEFQLARVRIFGYTILYANSWHDSST